MKLLIALACFIGGFNSVVPAATMELTKQDNFEWFNKRFPHNSSSDRQSSCPDCECGVPNTYVEDRIVNGDEAQPYKYGWMVRVNIITENRHRGCGGSVINDRYVLTAGHCIVADKDDYLLAFLQHDRSYLTEYLVLRTVDEIIVHESYNAETLDNDIALLKLNETLNISSNQNRPMSLRPVCLPSSTATPTVGQKGNATGWGFKSQIGPTSETLLEVDLEIVSDDDCRNINSDFTTNMFCAGYKDKPNSVCSGDSGGPYTLFEDGKYTLMGISSWVIACGEEGQYSGFVRVPKYVDWIYEKTGDACYCPPRS